jgi:hypothetical protein
VANANTIVLQTLANGAITADTVDEGWNVRTATGTISFIQGANCTQNSINVTWIIGQQQQLKGAAVNPLVWIYYIFPVTQKTLQPNLPQATTFPRIP